MATSPKTATARSAPDLATVMRRDASLAGLLPTARLIAELNSIYRKTVPPQLGGTARVVAVRALADDEGAGSEYIACQVTIHAHYPAVAAKLKQLEPRLIEAFEKAQPLSHNPANSSRARKITGIKFQVQPPEEPIPERVSEVVPLKANTRAALRAVAEKLSDSALKSRLREF